MRCVPRGCVGCISCILRVVTIFLTHLTFLGEWYIVYIFNHRNIISKMLINYCYTCIGSFLMHDMTHEVLTMLLYVGHTVAVIHYSCSYPLLLVGYSWNEGLRYIERWIRLFEPDFLNKKFYFFPGFFFRFRLNFNHSFLNLVDTPKPITFHRSDHPSGRGMVSRITSCYRINN